MLEPSFEISAVEPSGNSQSVQSSMRATTLAPIVSAIDRASLYLHLVLPFSSLMASSQTARMKSWKISAWVMVLPPILSSYSVFLFCLRVRWRRFCVRRRAMAMLLAGIPEISRANRSPRDILLHFLFSEQPLAARE
jgi:hypothetical protein